jgi:hypothetical protein
VGGGGVERALGCSPRCFDLSVGATVKWLDPSLDNVPRKDCMKVHRHKVISPSISIHFRAGVIVGWTLQREHCM